MPSSSSIDTLSAHGLPPRVIETWKAHGINTLLPLQEKALAEHGFLRGENLLVFAPTSSGKTFIAEMAALKHLEQNRRVVFLVPTKALAEEKYRTFHTLYGPLGYRIAISTRERPGVDKIVLQGQYDLLIAIYEKMKAYLITQPEMLANVALVVTDEIQTLGEPGRGALLDLLLTKINRTPYRTQFIGLSAVLGDDAHRLAHWLGSELLVSHERPLELREGVFDTSRQIFQYRAFNSGERGEEFLDCPVIEFSDNDGTSSGDEIANFHRDALLALARTLATEHREQVLLFVPTRPDTRNWAYQLAESTELPSAEEALAELARYEDTCSRDVLEKTLRQGIAFHNADLGWDLRELVERHFNNGSIRILVSTSTLGQGVNLTGRNVLHVPTMVSSDPWTGRQGFVPLTRSRFKNQGGRSARFSHAAGFGRSILVSCHPQECERLFRDYIEGPLENLTPQIKPEALDSIILDLIASRFSLNKETVTSFLHDTFTGRVSWMDGSAPLAQSVEKTIDSLLKQNLLTTTPAGMLQATGLGEVAAVSGLNPASIIRIANWLREGPCALLDDPIEALIVLVSTLDAHEFPLSSGGIACSPADWAEPLRNSLLYRAEGVTPTVQKILSPEGGFTRESVRDLKKALLLDAWIGPQETREIEEQFRVFSGTVSNLASNFSWLTQSAATLAKTLALDTAIVQALDSLSVRLLLGCGPEGLALRSLRVSALSRNSLQVLLREGYTTLPAIAEATQETLEKILPAPIVTELLAEVNRMHLSVPATAPSSTPRRPTNQQNRTDRSILPDLSKPPSAAPTNSAPFPLLEINLTGTGHARLSGKTLNLTSLPFGLLCLLAQHPETGLSYEELEQQLWPDTQVERQQVLAHRDSLRAAFAEIVGATAARDMVKIKRGRGLYLTLPAEQIQLQE
ncbi:TPA: hypothetical protein DDW35_02145 [Candidatus Sumerlaeota bacterium]|nr:hypothetical protein [Candidatus Sumerlaeota bacterium]